jgi:hypothetical protein
MSHMQVDTVIPESARFRDLVGSIDRSIDRWKLADLLLEMIFVPPLPYLAIFLFVRCSLSATKAYEASSTYYIGTTHTTFYRIVSYRIDPSSQHTVLHKPCAYSARLHSNQQVTV